MDQREVEQAIERIKIDYKEVQQIREKQNKLEKSRIGQRYVENQRDSVEQTREKYNGLERSSLG